MSSGIGLLGIRIAKLGMKAIYAPLKLFPRTDKSVFISRQSDAPSMDFMLLRDRIHELHPTHKVVVLSKQLRKSPGYIGHIVKQMYHISTSKNVVLDSYCIPISVLKHKAGLNIIQMWHAIGSMKCFGYAMLGKEEGSDPEIAKLFKMHENYDHILISSMSFLKDFEEGFHAKREQVKEIPLPRADILTDKERMAELNIKTREEVGVPQDKKVILYCPTFRKSIGESDSAAFLKLIEAIDFDKYCLVYKPHPLSALDVADDRIIKFSGNNAEAMALADFVITDYSSIIYEAGLAEKPVYLYAYDWNEYREKRALNIDLEREVPTVFSDNPTIIMDTINSKGYRWDDYRAFIKNNVTMPHGRCADEIIKLMYFKGEE